jgi:tetratricopeptide (TPR) repeat protein
MLQFLAEAAYLWSYRGKLDKAQAIFEALTVLAPDQPVGHLGLAEAWMSQQKFREAEKAAELATRSNAADRRTMAFAYKLRGKALMQLNKPKEAEKAWQRAAELDANGAEGKSALELMELARKLGLLPPGPPARVK